tara:strand:+ start:232 stop:999 length:768 start_codon:yes stop_codon:yes gene_type:complete
MDLDSHNSTIHGIGALEDNIIWIWVDKEEAVVIDPSICNPVKSWIEAKGLNLKAILQTHHHQDHIGGTEELLQTWPDAIVIAANKDKERIPFQTNSVKDGDEIILLNTKIKVIEVPGHTNAHIAFYARINKKDTVLDVLFCGDTLFGAGCGKLFEGTAKEMFIALKKLNQLPKNTKVYCGHEYTETNLRWALSIYPDNENIKNRLRQTRHIRRKGLHSLPSSLYEENQTNLFLRAKTYEEFKQLRLHKDKWKDLS